MSGKPKWITRARVDLQTYIKDTRAADRSLALHVAATRWPDRAVEAGVAAKLARHTWALVAKIVGESGMRVW